MEKLLKKIWNRFPSLWRKWIFGKIKSNLKKQRIDSDEKIEQETRAFLFRQGKIFLLCSLLGSLLLSVFLVMQYQKDPVILLERNPFGQGKKEVTMFLKKAKKKKKIVLTVEEQKLSDKEIEKLYDEFFGKLTEKIRGKNPSFQRVNQKLEFPEQLEGYPFEITYEPEDSAYIQLDGSLGDKAHVKKQEEGCTTRLTVTASYRQYHKKKTYSLSFIPENIKSRDSVFSDVTRFLKKSERKNRENAVVKLPVSYKDIFIEKEGRDYSVLKLVLVTVSFAICIPAYHVIALKKKGEKCQDEAQKDFPLVVHLLTLYMGAGLSFFSAVRRISQDYQKKREKSGRKYVFEKIMVMEQQMCMGLRQQEACQCWCMQFEAPCYQKLSLILTQSFTKGTGEARALMKMAEQEAFYGRIDRAKKEGEEASTRLLFPMILLLCQVMVLVMYPALIRFQGF